MRSWFTSRNGAITIAVLIALGAGLALLSAIATQGLSARTIAASLLVLSFVLFSFGGALYAGRAMWNWEIKETSSHLIWERGFVIVAVLVTVLGLALLEDMLRTAGDSVLLRLGMVAYLFGAVVVVVAETAYIGKRDWIYPQVVVYVVLAFLAQAVFGVALLRTGVVAGWVGWATIIWNLAWLVVLPIISRRDIYYPVLHHVAPLIIGIALLVQG
jgi:hypothetical protein